MKLSTITFAMLLLSYQSSSAQSFPKESPKQTIVQHIASGKISIEYSRPNTKGRDIFGTLIPYQQVWRTGADYPSFISFTDTAYINHTHQLPPGKYALYTIPSQHEWTVIFSSNTKLWGAYGYTPKDDALRIKVKPIHTESITESFQFSFRDVSYEQTTLLIEWANVHIPITIGYNIYNEVLALYNQSIKDNHNKWRVFWQCASYMLNKENIDIAEQSIRKSLSIEQNHMNLWTQALIHEHKKEYKKAIAAGNKALQKGLGMKMGFPYEKVYLQKIDVWLKKS